MKKLLLILFFLSLLIYIPKIEAKENITIHLFYRETCPHCKNEMKFLNEFKSKNKNIEVILYSLSEKENNDLYDQVTDVFNIEELYIPLTVIGTTYYIGYNDNIADSIKTAVNYYERNNYYDLITNIKNGNFKPDFDTVEIINPKREKITIPLIGQIEPNSFSLPLVAIIIGTVDGFNPCAMWVLLFLISMLLGMKNKTKMWLIGLTFLITSALIYMLLMFTWLQVSVTLLTVNFVKIAIAIFAFIFGFYSILKFSKSIKEDTGCTVVNKEQRIKIFNKIKKFTTEKNIFIALLGVITLAISVNVIELACSAGLPLLFTQILAINNLSNAEYIIYILIYILFFLIDDIIIFLIAMFTLERVGITNKYSKYVNLIGGIIMILIGIILLFNI